MRLLARIGTRFDNVPSAACNLLTVQAPAATRENRVTSGEKMATDPNFGMDKGELKALLMKSKQEPVSCALGKGKDPGAAYIRLDKFKQPKPLETLLEKDFPDLKDGRHGSASVDVDFNPRLVLFRINKPSSGLAPRVLRVLKSVGFSKVRFEFEDGSEPEEHGEDEETAPAHAQGASPPAAGPAVPPGPGPTAAPAIDAKALKDRLTALVHHMMQVIAADPARKDALLAIARKAQLALATNNLVSATNGADALEAAVRGAPTAEPAPASQADAPTAIHHEATPSGPVAYAKSRLAWLAMRQKLESDLETLREKVLAYDSGDEPMFPDLDIAYDRRVNPILARLDESLADALDAATNATDPAKRDDLVKKAREIIVSYQSFIAAEPLLGALETNPFVKLNTTTLMTTTLTALSAAIHAS